MKGYPCDCGALLTEETLKSHKCNTFSMLDNGVRLVSRYNPEDEGWEAFVVQEAHISGHGETREEAIAQLAIAWMAVASLKSFGPPKQMATRGGDATPPHTGMTDYTSHHPNCATLNWAYPTDPPKPAPCTCAPGRKAGGDATPLYTGMTAEELRAKKQESVLQEAERLIHGARQKDYGHPFDDFSKTAKRWETIFGVPVTPEQVALAMVDVKISRLLNTPDHRDSQVDIGGYIGTYELVRRERKRREVTP